MDSTEPVYGAQENSAYNGHFESTCYHPLLSFNREGDCPAAMVRRGNVYSAEDCEELPLPEIARQQKLGKEVVFRADAAFATRDLRSVGGAGRKVRHFGSPPTRALSGMSRNWFPRDGFIVTNLETGSRALVRL
jgi:hypothetical protein